MDGPRPNFLHLIKHHIMGAKTVLVGKINGHQGAVEGAVRSLADNNRQWGRAMAYKLNNRALGEAFGRLFAEHTNLEGVYIDQRLSCCCPSIDFGTCNQSCFGRTTLAQLAKNGERIVAFLDEHFGGREQWTDQWQAHLQCVREFIEVARLVHCKVPGASMAMLDARVDHCLQIGFKMAAVFQRARAIPL